MVIKDKIEILNRQVDSLEKESNIIYRKLFVLLASEAGVGSILFKTQDNLAFIIMTILFSILFLTIFINYIRLGILKKYVSDINLKIRKAILNAIE